MNSSLCSNRLSARPESKGLDCSSLPFLCIESPSYKSGFLAAWKKLFRSLSGTNSQNSRKTSELMAGGRLTHAKPKKRPTAHLGAKLSRKRSAIETTFASFPCLAQRTKRSDRGQFVFRIRAAERSAGCSADLVEESKTGETVAINSLVRQPELRHRMSTHSSE